MSSNLDLVHPIYADWERVREGKITRFLTDWDRARALADLGLEE